MMYVIRAFGGIFKWLGKFKMWIPAGMAGIFIVTQFFIDWIRTSLPFAFERMAKTVFAAELIINEKVHMAIANAQGYNLIDVFQIIIALYVFYALIKFFTKIQVKISGAQAEWGAAAVALLIVAIIEISAVKLIDGKFGFIPLWNGIIFLLMNMGPVITNIFGPPATAVVTNVTQNITQNITNSSFLGLGIFFKKKDI